MGKEIKKIFKPIIDVLTILIFLILVLIIFAKIDMTVHNRDYLSIFGYSFFKVATGSMEPNISENDIIIVKDNGEYKVDDVITYKENDSYITHRIIAINSDNIITKGDANNTNDDAINKDQVLGVVVSDFKHLEIWRQIFTTPSILISIFVTLILFDFAFSYKKKDDNKEPIKENKKSIETKEDINFDLPKPATFNAKDTQYILELTQKIDLPKLRTALKNDEKMPKLTTKEINNLDNKLKECPDKLPDLKTKEKDFLEYTIRLDLSELQKNINKKINRGE